MRVALIIISFTVCFIACNGSASVKPALAHENKALRDSFRKSFPGSVGWVNDFYSLFTAEQRQSLDSLISDYERKTTTQISIVTLDSSYAQENEFDDYSLALARAWGVGTKEKNNGILIAICPDYKRIRIQNGLGIEPYLSDAETKMVLDSIMLPAFRQANYYKGVHDGILSIIRKLHDAGLR